MAPRQEMDEHGECLEFEGTHDAGPSQFPALDVTFALAKDKDEAEEDWAVGQSSYEVVGEKKIGQRNCWLIHVATNNGRKQRWWVSKDDNARELLREIAPSVPSLRPVMWVNPAKEDEHAIEWLGQGATTEKRRQLGFNS